MSQEAENRSGEDIRIKEVPIRERSYKEEGRPQKVERRAKAKTEGTKTEERKPGKKDRTEEKRSPREAENGTGEG